jgi:hypothetical protein
LPMVPANRREPQPAVLPPSAVSICPVTNDAFSEARKTAARAISAGSRTRCALGQGGIIYSSDHEIRRVRMNQPHSVPVTPSWYGDSVGHYEGDTLVIDTVGVKIGPFAMVDFYGTPEQRLCTSWNVIG